MRPTESEVKSRGHATRELLERHGYRIGPLPIEEIEARVQTVTVAPELNQTRAPAREGGGLQADAVAGGAMTASMWNEIIEAVLALQKEAEEVRK